MSLTQYLSDLRRELRAGAAGEHAYRPALKALLEALGDDIQAVNRTQNSFPLRHIRGQITNWRHTNDLFPHVS